VLIVITLPLAALIALLVYLGDRDSVFYTQQRIGHLGRKFLIIKFRSLRKDACTNRIWKTPNHNDITLVGKYLRRFKFDEIPQLLNVLQGQMNFVGPRPYCVEHVYALGSSAKFRQLCKPGLTGLAQICGNNQLTETQRCELDRYYLSCRSFFLDLKILLLTAPAIIIGEQRALARFKALNEDVSRFLLSPDQPGPSIRDQTVHQKVGAHGTSLQR